MATGNHSQTIDLAQPPDEAAGIIAEALRRVGTVTKTEEAEGVVLGNVRYGLQSVTVRVEIAADEEGSQATVIAQGDDLWGAAAKSAVRRLVETVEHRDDPSHVPDRRGVSGRALALGRGGFVLAFLVVTALPSCLTLTLATLGALGLGGFYVLKRRTAGALPPPRVLLVAGGGIVGLLFLIGCVGWLFSSPVPRRVIADGVRQTCQRVGGTPKSYSITNRYRQSGDGVTAHVFEFSSLCDRPHPWYGCPGTSRIRGRFAAYKRGRKWYVEMEQPEVVDAKYPELEDGNRPPGYE